MSKKDKKNRGNNISGDNKNQGGPRMTDKQKKQEEKNLQTTIEVTPRIRDEGIDQVIKLSNDVAIWATLVPGGFQFKSQDKFVSEITGRLIQITPYLISFDSDDRLPAKKPHVESDVEIPEGYKRRCDIKLLASGQVVGISLARSSMKYQLGPYVKYLDNKGLRPDEVLTRVTSKQVSNSRGTFQVVVFEVVDGEPEEPEVTNGEPEEPSGSPSPQTAQAYPAEWA